MKRVADSDAHQALLEQLIVAVSRLARLADGQVAYLRTLDAGRLADELALEFDDAQGAVLPHLSGEQRRAVRALDGKLSTMSATAGREEWTHDALATSDAWARVRALSRDALATLHAEPVVPA